MLSFWQTATTLFHLYVEPFSLPRPRALNLATLDTASSWAGGVHKEVPWPGYSLEVLPHTPCVFIKKDVDHRELCIWS
jgi:hypothetical protein